MDFLGCHYLGLDNPLRFVTSDDLHDDLTGLLSGAGPMHLGSARGGVFLEFCEVFVQLVEAGPFGFGGGLSGFLPITEQGLPGIARGIIFRHRALDALTMCEVAGDAPGIGLELGGVALHDWTRISARWMVLIGRPSRSRSPCRCIRQLESLETI